jgi:NAD(P)-dependent dehydrogenase (short-subunit alcohol dehydrogenase family)
VAAGEAVVNTIKEAVPNVKIVVLPLDLASLDSVRQCAQKFDSMSNRLDILFLNAGVAGERARCD